MTPITEAYVDSLAINSSAMKNGRDLVKKNSFPMLGKSADGTLIFGECKGSGKEPYRCSTDFVKPDEPVFRCSCPSRQFPCKHILGLMYAYALGQSFETTDIPDEIVEKREKAEKREEKREEKKKESAGEAAVPRKKTNKTALLKKRTAQLEGIALLEKLVIQLTSTGLGSLDKKTIKTFEEQAKQLGNYYIPGLQTACRELLLSLDALNEADSAARKEALYTSIVERMGILHALVKKSRAYLTDRIDHPDSAIDHETTLEEQIGHAWQLAELREYGRIQSGTELVQLSFLSYTDQARSEFVDEGYWLNLQSGSIDLTRTYRPFRAAKHIREEDTVYSVVGTEELLRYPGELNTRVRWEASATRELSRNDLAAIRNAAHPSFSEVVKQVKNQIKNPLSDKNPAVLLFYAEIRQAGDVYVLVDSQDRQLPLDNIAFPAHDTTAYLPYLNKDFVREQALLVKFGYCRTRNQLQAQPLSIVTPQEIIRLLY